MDCGLNFATLRIRQRRRRRHQRAMAMWSHFWIAVRRRISASATSGEPFICPYRPSCWDGWPEAKSLSALFSSHPTITQRMAPNGRFYQSPPPEVEVRSSTRSSCVAVEAKSFPFYANPSFKTVAQSSAFKVRLHFLSISSKLLIGSAILFRRKYGRRFSVVFFFPPCVMDASISRIGTKWRRRRVGKWAYNIRWHHSSLAYFLSFPQYDIN